MKTIVYVIVAIIVVIAVYFAVTQNTQSPAPIGGVSDSLRVQPGNDTTTAIQDSLNSIDTGNLDAEMKNIDDQLNNL